jgi:hypothetical protein
VEPEKAHNVVMKRWLAAGVLVAVALALTVTAALGMGPTGGGGGVQQVAAQDPDDASPPGRQGGERPGAGQDRGHGPPPWAHGPAKGGGPPPWAHRPDAGKAPDWKSEWQAMSPRQRERTMRRLAEEHAAGMKAFGSCVADGRDDCEKPLPPGLAKKQSGR